MSKNQKAAVLMVAALAGQVYLGKVAKQQGAALGLSVTAVGLIGYAIGAESDTRLPSRKAKRHRLRPAEAVALRRPARRVTACSRWRCSR